MYRTFLALGIALVFVLIASQARSQASKQLNERAKSVATPPDQSWKQVDEINKDTDRTRNSYQQAKKSTEQAAVQSHYSTKKVSPGTGSAYKKPSPPKKKTPAKK